MTVTAAPRRSDRTAAVAMGTVAATLAVASAIHFGATPLGIHDRFAGAAPAEAVLAVIMVLGSTALLSAWTGGRAAALAAAGLTLLGFLYGLRVTTADAAQRPGDVAYHLAGIAVLTVALVVLARLPRRA